MTMENDAVMGGDDDALFNEVTAPKEAEASAPELPDLNPENEPEPKAIAPKVEAKPEPTPAQPEPTREDPRVPVSELIAERRQRQNLERQLEQMVAALNRAAPPPPQPQQPEIWDDPAQYVRAQVNPEIQRFQAVAMTQAREIAELRFGEDKVKAAQAAFDEMVASNRLHPAEYAEVMQSANPFAQAVKWHERHQIVSEIGTDPQGYKAKLRQELISDPEFRKEFMAALQGEAQQPTAKRVFTPIPSLSKVGAAALPSSNDDAPDDDSLWNTAVRRKR